MDRMDVDVQEQKRRNEVEKVLLDGAAAIVLHCCCFDLVYFAADNEGNMVAKKVINNENKEIIDI